MTSKVYRPEMSLYRDGQFWPSGKIPMVGAGSFNQHLDPCFTNSALPPPISKLSTPAPAESLLEQGQTGPQRCGKLEKYFDFFLPNSRLEARGRDESRLKVEVCFISSWSDWATPDSSQFLSSGRPEIARAAN